MDNWLAVLIIGVIVAVLLVGVIVAYRDHRLVMIGSGEGRNGRGGPVDI